MRHRAVPFRTVKCRLARQMTCTDPSGIRAMLLNKFVLLLYSLAFAALQPQNGSLGRQSCAQRRFEAGNSIVCIELL